MPLSAHLASLAYGFAVAVFSLGVFYIAGLLLIPQRWENRLRWPDSVVMGLALYIVLCWIAISSRNVPLKFIAFVFAAVIWIPASIRLRWLQDTLVARVRSLPARRWILDFSALYLLAYLLTPLAGPAFLPLGTGDNLSLVTYARYARHLLEFGTANVDLASFDYLHSPASMFVLAWQSLMFGRDPLQAAMPTLFLLAALFGMIAAETVRTAFGLTHRASMAIACIAVCAPLLRWMLSSFGMAEVLAAVAMLYVLRTVIWALTTRAVAASAAICVVVGGTLLTFTVPPWAGWGHDVRGGIAALLSELSFASLFGLPGNIPAVTELSSQARSAAVMVLALVPIVWAALARAARGFHSFDRPGIAASDRRLAKALVVYAALALIFGNVVVHATRRPRAARRPAEWRQLDQVSNLSFRRVTLKVADEVDGLSTALAMYYLPGRKAQVFGRDVSPQALSFDSVSKEQPMFIQNFGCEGAGHSDAVSVPSVGCLLMAPPSMAIGTSYPFNQTFLFLTFDYMTPREIGGRWNTKPTLQLQVRSDPQRVPLDRDLFLNLLLHPMTPEGTKPRRLAFRWGAESADRRGQALLGERRWLSLPVRRGDWTGNRVWTLPITIDFLDGRAVLFNAIGLDRTSPAATWWARRSRDIFSPASDR